MLAQAKYTRALESRSWSVTKDMWRCASVRTNQREVPVPELSCDMIWRYGDVGESRGDWICERVMGGVIGLCWGPEEHGYVTNTGV